EPFSEKPIEAHIGKDPAGYAEMSCWITFEQPADRQEHRVLENLLNRCSNIFASAFLSDLGQQLEYRSVVAEVGKNSAGIVDTKMSANFPAKTGPPKGREAGKFAPVPFVTKSKCARSRGVGFPQTVDWIVP